MGSAEVVVMDGLQEVRLVGTTTGLREEADPRQEVDHLEEAAHLVVEGRGPRVAEDGHRGEAAPQAAADGHQEAQEVLPVVAEIQEATEVLEVGLKPAIRWNAG
jgi:hypothetical protein